MLTATFIMKAAESDTWALTDALGRKAATAAEAGQRNDDKYVGIFYWTWHQGLDETDGMDNRNREVKNITEVLRQYPEAINDYDHPAWGVGEKRPGIFYWDEPIFGYYRTDDPWVLRRHAEMLADAGIDFVLFDCTNGSILWERSVEALMKTWDQAQRDGVNVPKIAFMLPFSASADSRKTLNRLYETIYKPGRYENLWFYWKGKPMIMAYDDNLDTTGTEGEIRDFFTFRPGMPDYVVGPERPDQWGWLEVYPTHGYAGKPGSYEQCTVGVAQNARAESGGHCCAFTLPGTYGRSYSATKGVDPRPDGYLYGWNFQEQWDRARDEIQPEVVFVTGWNEWTSGMWRKRDGWSDPLSFVDQFDREHSRDVEPTKGWGDKGDVYYQQLVDNVRRFKGMAPQAAPAAPKTITIGKDGAWDGVTSTYAAYRGNTFHRDHDGRFDRHYVDRTGRNDITGARVAHDDDNLYFLVTTADDLTAPSDDAWMMLFIDIDRDKSTGWNGYDYVVNRLSPSSSEVIIEKADGNSWSWNQAGTGAYIADGNRLEMSLPRAIIGEGKPLDFEFKIVDNMQHPGDVMDFYISGDAAPGGRFNYVYTSF
ncbi:MAG: hypothetical protein NC098_03925 [Lachnoclostridium sp.]|nr:hypothetical protein [Lachnoclostridium sp.]